MAAFFLRRRIYPKFALVITLLLFIYVFRWQTSEIPPGFGFESGTIPGVDERLIMAEREYDGNAPEFSLNDKKMNDEFYEDLIRADAAKQIPGLGDNGVAVTLQGEEKRLGEEAIAKEAFNLILSDKIALNRSVDDARHPLCKTLTYDDELPTASVIIIFTNERWSPLLRTVHSVINRTPLKLLKEIILVDDFSDHEELKGKLRYYVETRFPKGLVKLYRMKERSGLIRARLLGARRALGDVLVFLDAHCEVGVDWVQPLLQRIKQGRSNVVVPIIDVIDDRTLEYQHNKGSHFFQVGGFTWSGHFNWIDVESEESQSHKTPVDPTKSPTMAGGLFAIDKGYFWDSGSYDEQMDIWGGENLEMSFRVWLCGGRLETMPCSRVGHIFRNFHPYTFPGRKDTHGINTARLVQVWMDDYKRLFYLHRPDLKSVNIGDVTERMELKKRLQCKPFKWFLDNVYKSKYVPDEMSWGYGRVMTRSNGLCLDDLQNPHEEDKFILGVYSCHSRLFSSQLFAFSKMEELRREFVCAEIHPRNSSVIMDKCHRTEIQKWTYTAKGQLKHILSGLCISTLGLKSGDRIQALPCSDDESQVWTFDHFNSTVLIQP